jgi:hypothetical protein
LRLGQSEAGVEPRPAARAELVLAHPLGEPGAIGITIVSEPGSEPAQPDDWLRR